MYGSEDVSLIQRETKKMSDVLQGRAGGPGGIPFEGYAVPEGVR